MAGRKGHFEDCSSYLGKRIGSWTIIGTGFSNGKLAQCFVARCDCGNYGKPSKANLLNGASPHCRKCRPWNGANNPSWRGHRDVPQQVYGVMKRAAEVRDISVEIAIEDLQAQWEKQGGKCALTGVELSLAPTKAKRTASVDRIDNKRGYTKDNIQWVHKDVNLMKNKFDEDYFYEMCKMVVSNREAACLTPSA